MSILILFAVLGIFSGITQSKAVRIVVLGDIHGAWDSWADRTALKLLEPDLVLFTGDFGNEDIDIVRDIAKLDFPKAIILGNHDCWWSSLKILGRDIPEELIKPNAVKDQITALGEFDVGFNRLDYPQFNLSVVGSRPFSLGGSEFIFGKEHLSEFYGISDFETSAKRISELALGAPERHSVIFLGHNGPTGLGSKADDLCGKDFVVGAGDHGDPDLGEALKSCEGKREIPLVVFGHMHNRLAGDQGWRKKTAVNDQGTVFLNAAVVPRVYEGIRQFMVVDMVDNKVNKITEKWLKVYSNEQTSSYLDTVHEEVLHSRKETIVEEELEEDPFLFIQI